MEGCRDEVVSEVGDSQRLPLGDEVHQGNRDSPHVNLGGADVGKKGHAWIILQPMEMKITRDY